MFHVVNINTGESVSETEDFIAACEEAMTSKAHTKDDYAVLKEEWTTLQINEGEGEGVEEILLTA